ncbi:hypothetical protein I302_107469 [Kwoniella bestiolae CBS 10118]|uniref:Uncharacterized protein n=1 Tax=Kwoniella bestiolae CBS 10118 TaxID=1296100 RepID=A0A1B9FYF1_9TREE|nr:hypothetical protein I302_06790 [Kwoniella bestiolae CBS 10118]OCF23806.1 hypothetical protein I302_06790 [Kwoniella bestiolae CBS 10118]
MLLRQALSLLAVIGLTSAAVVKREDRLEFEIEFKDDAGYLPCDKDWVDEPGMLIDRTHRKVPFNWDAKDIGTERDKRYFKFYVYEHWIDSSKNPFKTFRCTLQALETSSIVHDYTLEGDDEYFDSKLSHKQAHLWCDQEGGQDPDFPKIDSHVSIPSNINTFHPWLGPARAVLPEVKRSDYALDFNIKFDEDSGYQKTEKDFDKSGEIIRGEHTAEFNWNESEFGTANAKRYFNFYTYEDDDDDAKPTARFMCTLEGLQKTGYLEILTYDYELQGEYNWLHSKLRHEEARLTCRKDGPTLAEPDITTDYMPLKKPGSDDDDD